MIKNDNIENDKRTPLILKPDLITKVRLIVSGLAAIGGRRSDVSPALSKTSFVSS